MVAALVFVTSFFSVSFALAQKPSSERGQDRKANQEALVREKQEEREARKDARAERQSTSEEIQGKREDALFELQKKNELRRLENAIRNLESANDKISRMSAASERGGEKSFGILSNFATSSEVRGNNSALSQLQNLKAEIENSSSVKDLEKSAQSLTDIIAPKGLQNLWN